MPTQSRLVTIGLGAIAITALGLLVFDGWPHDASTQNADNQDVGKLNVAATALSESSDQLARPGESSSSHIAEIFPGNAHRALYQLKNRTYEKLYGFPTGKTILINYQSKLPMEDFPAVDLGGPVKDIYLGLEPLASEGNSGAAWRIWEALQMCKDFPKSPAELAAVVKDIETGVVVSNSPQPVEESVAMVTEWSQPCMGLENSMYDSARDFLALAASNGDARSALALGQFYDASRPDLAIGYYEEAWAQGSALGAEGFGRLMASGQTGREGGLVESQGHIYAANAILLALYDGLDSDGAEAMRRELQEKLLVQEREMSLSALPEIYARAQELIESNDNCCRY